MGTELNIGEALAGVFFNWNNPLEFQRVIRLYPRRINDSLVLFNLTSSPDDVVRLESPLMQPQVTRAIWTDEQFTRQIDSLTVSATEPNGKVVGFIAYVKMDPQANAPDNVTVAVRANRVTTGCVITTPDPTTPPDSRQIPKTGVDVPFQFLIRIQPPFNNPNCTTAVVRYEAEISLSNNGSPVFSGEPHQMLCSADHAALHPGRFPEKTRERQ
jgi:hypothetical protein